MIDSTTVPTQENRRIRLDVESTLPPDTLLLRGFSLVDELSAPFELTLDIQSLDPDVDFADVIGKRATVTVELPNERKRYLTGVVLEFELVGFEGPLANYRALVVPWLRLLRQSLNCRIFENVQVPEVVQAIFRSAGYADFRLELTGTYCTRSLVAQYNENDFNLISRLLESVGIFYYFEHTASACTVVLCDSHGAARGFPGYEVIQFHAQAGEQVVPEHIHHWQVRSRFRANQASVTSYDYEHPRQLLRRDRLAYISPSGANIEHYEFEDFIKTPEVAENIAMIRAEELLCKETRQTGSSDALGLCVGYLFSMSAHPRKNQNTNYLITGLNWQVDTPSFSTVSDRDGFTSKATFEALDAARTFRPARQTPPQKIMGLQTGTVVGNPGEAVNTDELGRVRVQFPWADPDTSTCWVRVAQKWAGKGWGMVFLPHVGDEVCVSFINGDPDNPIVTGRVYNADHTPPHDPSANPDVAIIQDKAGNIFKMVSTPGSEEIKFFSPNHSSAITIGPNGIKTETDGDNEESSTNKIETTMGANTTTVLGANTETIVGLNTGTVLGANFDFVAGLDFAVNVLASVELAEAARVCITSSEAVSFEKVGRFQVFPHAFQSFVKSIRSGANTQSVIGEQFETIGTWNIQSVSATHVFVDHHIGGAIGKESWDVSKSIECEGSLELKGSVDVELSSDFSVLVKGTDVAIKGTMIELN